MTKDALFFLFKNLMFEFDYISLQSVVLYLYNKQPQVLDSM